MSDSAAFHEVDDAVRKDELKEWWDRWGTLVVAVAVIVVVVVAGAVGWRQYDNSRRGEASAAYSAALDQIAQNPTAARTAFEQQAKNAPEPYRSLAAMVAAQLQQPLDALAVGQRMQGVAQRLVVGRAVRHVAAEIHGAVVPAAKQLATARTAIAYEGAATHFA